MPMIPIKFNPGMDTNATPLLNETQWSSGNLIRFFQGKLQKIGGWFGYAGGTVLGIARGIFSWIDLSSNVYVVTGSNYAEQVVIGPFSYDITPLQSTVNLTSAITTVAGLNQFNVNSTGAPVLLNDYIYVVTDFTIDNVYIFSGYYQVTTLVDANNFIVTNVGGPNFVGTVTGGTTALFTTTNTMSTVQVTLTNNGLVQGNYYTVPVSTTVGGITIFGQYVIQSIVDANNFIIDTGTPASSSTSAHENSGNVRINFLINADQSFNGSTAPQAWGTGGYGEFLYGYGNSNNFTPLRQWFFGNWGEILISSYTDGGIYTWDPSTGYSSGVITQNSTVIAAAPTNNTSMFIAMPERQVVALGANGDPLLVAWSDVDDYTTWTPTVTNQAGSYRIPKGSFIVGGIQAPQFGMIWTDMGLWAMQYLNQPLVYGFTEIGNNCGLIAPRAMGTINGKTYWMSYNGFFMYDGTVQPVPCPVWDAAFRETGFTIFGTGTVAINPARIPKITCAVNSSFNEIMWFIPAANESAVPNSEGAPFLPTPSAYVKYNTVDNVWDFAVYKPGATYQTQVDINSSMIRTAWFDKAATLYPIGTDSYGNIYQHEYTVDAHASPMRNVFATSGWFKISEGLNYLYIDRLLPDFILQYDPTSGFSGTAEVNIIISTVNYPGDTPVTKTFTVTQQTEYLIVRLRGRLASITVGSNIIGNAATNRPGTFWRLGECLMLGAPSGRR